MVSWQRVNGKEYSSKRRRLVNGMSGSNRPDRAIPLDRRLRAISDSIPASCIDELWVFPPLPNRDIACEFLVLLCYDGGEDRRRILTSHVDAHASGEEESEEWEWVQRLREHGTAPQRWAAGIPDRLLQRLSEAGTPEVISVGGQAGKWEDAIARFADGGAVGSAVASNGTAGNGNGNGAGRPSGSVSRSDLILVDSGATREISFRTVVEATLPEQEEDGVNSEAGHLNDGSSDEQRL